MKSKSRFFLVALCLAVLAAGPVLAQPAPANAGACAQIQSPTATAPAPDAQLFPDLQMVQAASLNCGQYCTQHPCRTPTDFCGWHINTVGLLVCGCYSGESGQ